MVRPQERRHFLPGVRLSLGRQTKAGWRGERHLGYVEGVAAP
jgi:hypothetical protein